MDEEVVSLADIICALDSSLARCPKCNLLTPMRDSFARYIKGSYYLVYSPFKVVDGIICLLCVFESLSKPECNTHEVKLLKRLAEFRYSIYGLVGGGN